MLYAAAKEYNADNVEYFFTEEDIGESDSRRQKRLHGESETHGWEEAKKNNYESIRYINVQTANPERSH